MSDSRVKILYCENNVDGTIGGSYYSLLYLVQGLDRRAYEPIVLFKRDHRLMSRFREQDTEVILWPPGRPFSFARRAPGRLLPRVLAPVQSVANLMVGLLIPALVRAWFLRRRRIQIVHLNNSILANHEWMMAARLARVTCVTHERGINTRYARSARFFGRRLDAVICISEAVRRTLLEGAGPFDNLVVVPNGLDPAAMHATRSRAAVRAHYGLDDAVPVVCMMGNIRKWKGQDTVIRAVHEARDAFPDLRLLLVGETSAADGDYEQQLKALVADLGLGERVVFAGYQSNVADFLEACDVVVHASVLPEPFGRVVLDAMACRKPVVAAHGGAIPEIVVEGETGLTFPPGDASALAAQLARVLGDRGLAERMGQLGYERLMQHFHIDRNVEATERLYRRLLGAAV